MLEERRPSLPQNRISTPGRSGEPPPLRRPWAPRTIVVEAWALIRQSVDGFIADDALSHAAAIAFYAATSLAPILLIVVAIAGIAFGHEAAQLALSAQIAGLMGPESAGLFKTALQSASGKVSGTWAAVIGFVTLLVTASGVFGEMQATLNLIWKIEPSGASMSRLLRARIVSLGLVGALGFLLIVSLIASAAIAALGDLLNAYIPFGELMLSAINAVVSFVLIAILFGAIYKVLPDRSLRWRDVRVGALATAALFTIGKSLIGWYLGTSAVASSYGAAGGLLITLLWVYYSSVIFLFGAEITRAFSLRFGSNSRSAAVIGAVKQSPPLASYARRKTSRSAADLVAVSLIAAAWAGTTLLVERERISAEARSFWRQVSRRVRFPES
jgi:membrane protein